MGRNPTPTDMGGIQDKLGSLEKLAKRLENTTDEEELRQLGEEQAAILRALEAAVDSFCREFDDAVRAAEAPALPKHRVKLERDQIEYVREHTGETLFAVVVDAPPPGETLPYSKDQITFFAIQAAKAIAAWRKSNAANKKARREAQRQQREAEAERDRILQELAERDPEAAEKFRGS